MRIDLLGNGLIPKVVTTPNFNTSIPTYLNQIANISKVSQGHEAVNNTAKFLANQSWWINDMHRSDISRISKLLAGVKHTNTAVGVATNSLSWTKDLFKPIANSPFYNLGLGMIEQHRRTARLFSSFTNVMYSQERRQFNSMLAFYGDFGSKIAQVAAISGNAAQLESFGNVQQILSDSITEELLQNREAFLEEVPKILTKISDWAKKQNVLPTWKEIILLLVGMLFSYYLYTQSPTIKQIENLQSSANRTEMKVDKLQQTSDHLQYSVDNLLLQGKQIGFNKRIVATVSLLADAKRNSYVLSTLHKNSTVQVFDIQDGFAYITYFDSISSHPQAGWISTKYFEKNMFSKTFRHRMQSK